jgi:EAL domain-containing protein (putative c-di-GMP-specific phosphodiesterase class I)
MGSDAATVGHGTADRPDLRDALARGELHVYYQPMVRFDRSEVFGFEALVRWHHPDRGVVLPADFLPDAEASGAIVPIGTYVLTEACRQAARWRDESALGTPPCVAVNLSAAQLADSRLVATVEGALATAGLDASALVLEVAERVLMEDRDLAIAALDALRRVGVRVSVDDFGVADTSVTLLHRLPVQVVKIDPSFVDGLGADGDDSTLVRTIVALGHALGLTVTAEGVETPVQLSEVRSLGCDGAQGFYFAHPQPAEVVRALVHHRLEWRTRDAAV